MGKIFKRTLERYIEEMKKKGFNNERYEKITIKDIWVLFVIDEEERNVCDQKWIEIEIYEK